MRRFLAAVLIASCASTLPTSPASAGCDAVGAAEAEFFPYLFSPTSPGADVNTCVNLGPAGMLAVGNASSVRLFDVGEGTGVGTHVSVCYSGAGCTPTGQVAVGWFAPDNALVVVDITGSRVDAGAVVVWPASWTGERVPVCVTTNRETYPC